MPPVAIVGLRSGAMDCAGREGVFRRQKADESVEILRDVMVLMGAQDD